MAVERSQVEELFESARRRADATERAAYLAGACIENAELRAEVESLLKAHDEASGFLPTLERPTPVNSGEPLGSRIGPYKLLQKLGEGGMGTVYMAEQERPVRRRVALKIIKAGMDSVKVLARFDQERQALTMMDHPNIARAFDAGATDTGRPYFVMELVKGIPITQYCDQEHLTLDERLALFIPVCQAIQHAHQKGIIHRDIKPSNVLISLYDARPVPKVIDFGVAKATSQPLTERTMFTEVGSIVGTLEYMAPEQAELNNLDIDTRADIYSLGVLLYELLTGSPPFTSQQLRSVAFTEMLRLIREVEPPRPSMRLSSSEELATIVAHRKLELRRLPKLVRYDLDWIVMKALEKDRGRRYETANALAQDVQRYLDDEPVLAGPPRAGYRLRKFLRRNKGPVLAAALVFLALVGGIVGTTWQWQMAAKLAHEKAELAEVERQSRERADRQSGLLLRTLTLVVFDIQSKLAGVPGAQEVRRSLLSTAVDGLRQVAWTLDTAVIADHALVRSHLDLGDVFLLAGGPGGGGTEEARKQFQSAHELAEKLVHDDPQSARAQGYLSASYCKLGDVNLQSGDAAAARDAYQKYLQISQKLAHDDPQNAQLQRDLALSYERLGDVNLQLGNVAAAGDAYQKDLVISQTLAHDIPHSTVAQRDLALSHLKLGDVELQLSDTESARNSLQKLLEISQKLAHDDPRNARAQRDLAVSCNRLGNLNLQRGETAAARDAFQKCLEINQKLAYDDPQNSKVQQDLAVSYGKVGDVNLQLGNAVVARDAFRKLLEISQKLAQDDPQNAQVQRDLALSYERLGIVNLQLGNMAVARDAYVKDLEISQKLAHDDPQSALTQRELSVSYNGLGDVSLQLGDAATARDAFQKGLEISRKLAHDDPQNARAQADLACSYAKLGDANLQLANVDAARDVFQKSMEISQKLAHDDPRNAQAERDLAVSYGKLGDVNLQLDNVAAAGDAYQKDLVISLKLARDDPQSANAQRDLSLSYVRLGDVNLQLSDTESARNSFQKLLEISQKLAHDDPRNARAQTDLASSFGRLGNLEMGSENFSAAMRWFAQGVAILEKLDQDGKLANQPLFQGWLAEQRANLKLCKAAERAIDNLDFALGRTTQEIPDLLGIRSRVLARQGKHADAAATAEKLASLLEPVSGANRFQAAQCYALCAGGVKPASPRAQLSAEEQALQERYAARAVELLKQSHAAGYFKYPDKHAKLDQDRNLDALRARDDFKKLLVEISAAPLEKK
jgi:eukaryotic-like serine/threonine-protein kinase